MTPAPPGDGVGQLGVRTIFGPRQAIVSLAGELDLATAPSFADALAHVDAKGVDCLVIDMAGLEFIDSSGLHRLVVALKRQRERGGEMVLRSPRPSTLRVLEMVGLTQLFTIT